jgi:hypothetical protein
MTRKSIINHSRHSVPVLAALTLTVVLSSALSPSGGLCAADKRPLEGVVVGDLGEGEYLVKTLLTVPDGDTLRIGAGAVLYFEQLTGIDVRGVLTVSGAPGIPVVMTSSNDTAKSAQAPQAFDWNGVRSFGPDAAVFMRHASVSNSVYGVQIWDPSSKAELRDVFFRDNGYASLMRGGEIVPTEADKAVSAAWNVEAPQSSPRQAGKPVKAKPAKSNSPGTVSAKFVVNVSAVGVAAAGMTACYIGLSNTNTYQKHYELEGGSGGHSEYYQDKIRKNITVSAIGAAAAGLGLGCIGVTLFF